MSKEHKVGLPPNEALAMLDKVSPTFCLAKWLQVTLNLHTGSNASCCLTPPARVDLDKVRSDGNEFHNTQENLNERQKLLEGKKASSCQFCWSQEAKSDKSISERIYKSASPWAYKNLDQVLKTGAEKPINPTYLEVSFSSKCNLKCAYCSPQTSSSIYHEIKKFGPYTDSSSLNDIREIEKNFDFSEKEDENPYIPEFYKWFEKIASGLEVLRFTGGEPFLHENVFKTIEFLKERAFPHLTIEINSNLSLPKSTIERFITLIDSIPRENYKGIKIISSIDTGFEEASYIRNGLNTDYFKTNVDLLLESIPDIEFRFTVTFSILSIFNFDELIEYTMKLKNNYKTYDKILLSIYPLISPYHLSLKILPAEYEGHLFKIQKKLKLYEISEKEPFGFNEYEIDSFNKVVSFYEDKYPKSLREKLQRDFCYFIKDFDARKNSNIVKTFPEIKSFMELCLQLVQNDLQRKLISTPSTVEDFKQLLMFFQRKTSISEANRKEVLAKISECLTRVPADSFYEVLAIVKNIYIYEIQEELIGVTVERYLNDPKGSVSSSDAVWSFSELLELLKPEYINKNKEKWKGGLFDYFLRDLKSGSNMSWAWIKAINFLEYNEDEVWKFIDQSSAQINRIDHLLKIYRWNDLSLWTKRYNGKWERNWLFEIISRENPELSTGFINQIGLTSDGYIEILWYFLVAKTQRNDLFEVLNQHATANNKEVAQKFIKKNLPVNPIAIKRLKSLKNILK